MSKTTTLHTIPNDATVDLKFSGAFHGRLLNLYIALLSKMDNSKLEGYVSAIKNNKISELPDEDRLDAISIETLTILINNLELKFKEDGKIEEKEVEIPTSD